MERWSGKIAVVTGASSGIGASIAVELAKTGLNVIGLARRVERVEELRSKLPEDLAQNLHAYKCDVSKEESIVAAFAWIRSQFGGIDVLINNAAVFGSGNLLDADNSEMLKSVLDTNVLGLVLCTREAFASMRERQVAGHVVMINSLAGHWVPNVPDVGSMQIYAPSKHAVTAITEVLRQEFNAAQSKTKVTSISPGFVMTEMVPESMRTGYPHMLPEDIAAAVLYALGTLPHVQVHEITMRPVNDKF